MVVLLLYDHKQVRVTQGKDGAASTLCYSAILLSLPRATGCLTAPLTFTNDKVVNPKRKRRDIEAVGLRIEIKRYCDGKKSPVVLASPESSQF